MSSAANSVFSYPISYPFAETLRPSRAPSRLIVNGAWGPSWQKDVTRRLNELLVLPTGWNGYQAPPVSLENVAFAVDMLRAICPPNMPAPQIVPGASGDLQIEWHSQHSVVEIHVKAPNEVIAWRETARNPNGEEIELTNDFLPIISWIEEVRGDGLAAITAAA